MSVQVEKLEKNMAKLTIEVSAEDLEKAMQAAYQKAKGRITLPGFRKGKVPRNMVEKMYGPEIFYEDAANLLIQKEYGAAVKESGEDVVSQPEIDIVQLEKGKPFIFTAEVAVKPEVTLGKYMGVTVTKIDTTVTDEEVDAEVERQRENNARSITIEDRPVADGDTTVIDFEGFVDGEAFEGGKGENYPLVIGSHSFIDTFEDQLIGKNSGEEVEVNVTFPEDYHAADLAGKAAVFKCTVKEIKEKELPASGNRIMGRDISGGKTVELRDIDPKMGTVVVEGILFKISERLIKNGNHLVSLLITDNKTTVCTKAFVTEAKWGEINDLLKPGDAVKIRGEVQWDTFENMNTIMFKDLEKADREIGREDTWDDGKRVELHIHSKMSQMDGFNEAKDIVAQGTAGGCGYRPRCGSGISGLRGRGEEAGRKRPSD